MRGGHGVRVGSLTALVVHYLYLKAENIEVRKLYFHQKYTPTSNNASLSAYHKGLAFGGGVVDSP